MSETRYSVSLTDWTQKRGYRNSGRGWRVRCFAQDPRNWNAMATTVFEDFFKTRTAALKKANELATEWNAKKLYEEAA